MTIVKTVDIPDTEIENYIDDEVIDASLEDIENWLLDKYNIENSDLESSDYIFFLNIMKEKIDERILFLLNMIRGNKK